MLNLKRISLSVIVILLACQFGLGQTAVSSITLRIKDGKCFVSGIVASEQSRLEAIRIIKEKFGDEIEYGKLTVDRDAGNFERDWSSAFGKLLRETRNAGSGLIHFETARNDYPELSPELMNAEIVLNDRRTRIRLVDYPERLIVLSFVVEWAGPARVIINVLGKLYTEHPDHLLIVGVSPDEYGRSSFREFIRKSGVEFQTGFADHDLYVGFCKISGVSSVPQTFLVKNGKLRAVFVGSSETLDRKMVEEVERILQEG